MTNTLTPDEQKLLDEARHIQRYLDGLVIPTRYDDGTPMSLVARINVMTSRCMQSKTELAESRYRTAAALEARLIAAEREVERLRSGKVDVQAVLLRIPTVARLYYTGFPPRRYRRASTMNGPGEPLVHRSHVERELHRLWAGEGVTGADN